MGGGAYRGNPATGPPGPMSGVGAGGAGGAAVGGMNAPTPDLDMLGITMELLDQTYNKDDKGVAMDQAKGMAPGPAGNYGSQPDSTGPVRAGANSQYTENQVRQEARKRYQDFVEISNAKDAPDATTRASNLFRNQLRQRVSGNPGGPGGMMPGQGGPGGFPPGADEMGHDMEGKGSSLLQKLLLD